MEMSANIEYTLYGDNERNSLTLQLDTMNRFFLKRRKYLSISYDFNCSIDFSKTDRFIFDNLRQPREKFNRCIYWLWAIWRFKQWEALLLNIRKSIKKINIIKIESNKFGNKTNYSKQKVNKNRGNYETNKRIYYSKNIV